jgi:hypothetical protein
MKKLRCRVCGALIATCMALYGSLHGNHDDLPEREVAEQVRSAQSMNVGGSSTIAPLLRHLSVNPQQIPDIGYGYAQVYRTAVKIAPLV